MAMPDVTVRAVEETEQPTLRQPSEQEPPLEEWLAEGHRSMCIIRVRSPC